MGVSFGYVGRNIRDYCAGCRKSEDLSIVIKRLQCSIWSEPDYKVLSAVLKSFASRSSIRLGQSLHGYIVKHGYLASQAVSKALLNMYAKCSSLDDCQRLFGEVDNSDAVVWNIVLSGFAASRINDSDTMRLFNVMHSNGETKPSSVTMAIILPVCARIGGLDVGKCVHSYGVKSGLETHTLVGNALISMYAKCGGVCSDAYAAFNSIVDKDVVSWNAMIAGFYENKLANDAFKLFCQMLNGPVEPNYAAIASIFAVCASLESNVSYRAGREIYCYVLRRTELAEDISVCNAVMSYYLRIGRMKEAEVLFRRMKSRDLVSWNAIIAGYVSNGEWQRALDLFQELFSLKVFDPDPVTLLSILPACANLQNLHKGRMIHGYILRHPGLHGDTALGNALVSFYSRCQDIEGAFRSFLTISKRDLISWNSMLDAYAEGGCNTQFLNLLCLMLEDGITPDSITILTIINFCTTTLRADKVKETHSYSLKGGLLVGDVGSRVGNAIIDAYAKCGNMKYASTIFQWMSEKRNLITCNSMISGYVNCGSHDDAYRIFSGMSERDLTTWNLMVRAYAENDYTSEALGLIYELQAQGMKPDAMTIMSLLPLCAQLASLHLLSQCHGFVIRACFEDVRLNAALLDVYAKCGSIASAYKLFHSCPFKDLVLYTAMVGGYAMHGMGDDALRVFSDMLHSGIKPDHVIITAVLSACSRAGLVDDGLKLFDSIELIYGIKPTMEQYACVVDLLARGGKIHEAYSFVTDMPLEANASVWGTLLGACRTYHNVELGRVVASRLFEVEAGNIGNYVVMSNLYAADAKWDGVTQIRKLMRTKDLKKPAGCSWIELDGEKNVFIAGDTSHPKRNIIYSILCTLDQQIKSKSQAHFG